MTAITVSSGKGVFFTKLALGSGLVVLCYHFLAGIIFFGSFIALDLIALFYVIKMNISEEAERLGRKGNAILGFMGMIVVQVILLRNSNFVNVADVNTYVLEAERKDLLGYSILMIGASITLFITTYNIVKKVIEECQIDPPPGLLYAFTATSSLGSALLMYGFFFRYGAIYIDISPSTFFEIRVKEAGVWLVIALFAMYFFMGRLKFKSGEFATVYFFGRPVYSLTGHRDLMVPVLSALLHFITELANQHPIGFSVDFKVIRRDLPRQESYELVMASPGEQMPVRLDGKGQNDSPPLPRLPPGARPKLLPPPMPPSPQNEPPHTPSGGTSGQVSPPTMNKGESNPAPLSKPQGPSAEDPPLRIGRVIRRGDELKPKEEVAKEVADDLFAVLRGRRGTPSTKEIDPTTTADFSRNKKPPQS